MAAVEAVVDLAAIAHNVGVLRERSGAEVLAVVKADGYGHGAVPVARAALQAGAAGIGVATVEEAAGTARRRDRPARCIAWLHTPATDFAAAVRSGVEVVVSSPASAVGGRRGRRRAGTHRDGRCQGRHRAGT